MTHLYKPAKVFLSATSTSSSIGCATYTAQEAQWFAWQPGPDAEPSFIGLLSGAKTDSFSGFSVKE